MLVLSGAAYLKMCWGFSVIVKVFEEYFRRGLEKYINEPETTFPYTRGILSLLLNIYRALLLSADDTASQGRRLYRDLTINKHSVTKITHHRGS